MDTPVQITPIDGDLVSKNLHFQPFSRFPSLLNFARIFLPTKHTFSYSKIGRNKLHPFSKISVDVLSLLDFEMRFIANFWISSLRRSCLVGVDVSCSGFMEAGSMRSLDHLPIANSTNVLPLSVTCVFLTVAALRINWAGVICDRVVLVQIVGGCIHECWEKLLEQSCTHLSSIWPRCVRSNWKSPHIMHSIECLHVMRMMDSLFCTNSLRIHLGKCPSIHEVWKWLLIAVKCDVAPSKIIRNPKVLSPKLGWSMVQEDKISKFFSSQSAHAWSVRSWLGRITEWGTSSRHAGKDHEPFQECPSKLSSSWTAQVTCGGVSGEGISNFAHQTNCLWCCEELHRVWISAQYRDFFWSLTRVSWHILFQWGRWVSPDWKSFSSS